MSIVERFQVFERRIRSNMWSSPSGVVEIEVSQYNGGSISVLEQKREQGKDISYIRRDREAIRKGSNG
jgi:hypothetical protein